jgi:hypothetical protein
VNRFIADDDEVIVGSVGDKIDEAELCRDILCIVLPE